MIYIHKEQNIYEEKNQHHVARSIIVLLIQMKVEAVLLQRSRLNMLKIGYYSITKILKVHQGWLTGTTRVPGMFIGGSQAPRESPNCPPVGLRHHGGHRNVHRWLTGTAAVTRIYVYEYLTGTTAATECVHEWLSGTTAVSGLTTGGARCT